MLFVDNNPIDKHKYFVLDRNSPLINRTFNENVYYLIEEILYLRNTTHCVVDSKQNILVQTGSQTYNYLEEYIDSVRAKGRYAFTLEELKGKLEVTDKAILQNLYRLKLKNKIVQNSYNQLIDSVSNFNFIANFFVLHEIGHAIYDNMNKTDLKNFSFYKSNEKDFEIVKKRLINYFTGGI